MYVSVDCFTKCSTCTVKEGCNGVANDTSHIQVIRDCGSFDFGQPDRASKSWLSVRTF